jgi:hypothetical protein
MCAARLTHNGHARDPHAGRAGRFDESAFYAALDAQRTARRMTWSGVARATGVSSSTLSRMSRGQRPDLDSLAALAAWGDLAIDDFVRGRSKTQRASTIATLAARLRGDPHLSPESAAALEAIVKVAYDRLRRS